MFVVVGIWIGCEPIGCHGIRHCGPHPGDLSNHLWDWFSCFVLLWPCFLPCALKIYHFVEFFSPCHGCFWWFGLCFYDCSAQFPFPVVKWSGRFVHVVTIQNCHTGYFSLFSINKVCLIFVLTSSSLNAALKTTVFILFFYFFVMENDLVCIVQ